MFGSQIHALPDTNTIDKIESTVYTFSTLSLRAPKASESLLPRPGDQCSSIPLSWQTDVFCIGRYNKLCTSFSVYFSYCHGYLGSQLHLGYPQDIFHTSLSFWRPRS